ncbi:hypothetical protein HPB49_013055 [Dermacentor silvarum]|uniref:Uncharacterized protein n=1 Tax=Dermacentor silvarum TaxID=543639 RepID=A0ACB8CX42_DERSI|nr:hypothetical protein HPB49_013055 [Dermacentor silvarum]
MGNCVFGLYCFRKLTPCHPFQDMWHTHRLQCWTVGVLRLMSLQERLPFMYDPPFIRPVLIFHGGALYGKKSWPYWFVSNAQTLSSFHTMHAPTVVVRLGCASAGWRTYDRNILVAPLW